MKTKIYSLLLFTLIFSNSYSQTVIMYSAGCGIHQLDFSFVDATGRNFFGGITDALSWNATTNQWEWSDYSTGSPVVYSTNSYASSPNPPCLNTGTWVAVDATCGTLNDITGDCQFTITAIGENAMPGDFTISQNHSSDKISILYGNAIPVNMTVSIFNSLGGNVYEQLISDHETEISLSNQENGIYFVQLKSKEETITKKIFLSR